MRSRKLLEKECSVPLKQYSLLYPFSEVNYAVFQNAGIFLRKQSETCEIKVYTPSEFATCYFHADSVEEISPRPYSEYSEVSNHHYREFSKKNFRTWFNPQIPNFIIQKFQQSLTAQQFHRLPARIKADYKMRKFLFSSGIYRRIKNAERKQKRLFLGTAIYYDLGKLEKYKCDNNEAMQRNFENLYQMISSRGILSTKEILKFYPNSEKLKESFANDLNSFELANNFITRNKNVAYIRTRLISGAAQAHNTNPESHRLLVETLLDLGYSVLSLGTTTLKLGILNPKYLEIDHNLSIGSQFYLAAKCEIRIMSAEAGLFVAWAATEMPLVLIGREWSELNLLKPVSLISARRFIGIPDKILNVNFTKQDVINQLR